MKQSINVDLILYLRILDNEDESIIIDIDKNYGISIIKGKGPDPSSKNYDEWAKQLQKISDILSEKAKEKIIKENKVPLFGCKMEDEDEKNNS